MSDWYVIPVSLCALGVLVMAVGWARDVLREMNRD